MSFYKSAWTQTQTHTCFIYFARPNPPKKLLNDEKMDVRLGGWAG